LAWLAARSIIPPQNPELRVMLADGGLEARLLRNFLAQPEQAQAWRAAQARVARGLSTPDEALDELLGG